MAWRLAEATELLDVHMDHLAGMLALVAPDRFSRLDIAQPRQSSTLEDPADGGGRDADLMGDVVAGPTLPPQRHDALGDRRSGGLWHRGGPRDARRMALEKTPPITDSAISSRRNGVNGHSCGCSFGPSDGC